MKNCYLFNIVQEQVTPPKDRADIDLDEWIAKYNLEDSILDYSQDSSWVNKSLYNGAKLSQISPDLAKLFQTKGNFKGTELYRGTAIPKEILDNINEGMLVHNSTIISTSEYKTTGINFAGNFLGTRNDIIPSDDIDVLIQINVPTESRVNAYPISEWTKFSSEAEVLIPPSSYLQVQDILEPSGNVPKTIVMTLQPDSILNMLNGKKLEVTKGLMSMATLIPLIEGVENE